jgi:hypothetical protein
VTRTFHASTSGKRDPITLSVFRECTILALAVMGCAAWFLYAEHRVTGGEWGFSLDDSWIYATFARNIATGHGYSFNPGEHIAGATGPLYAFILALLYALFRDVVMPAKVLGIACLGASSILMYFAVRSLDTRKRLKPLVAGLLVGISPSLVWSAVSGMEIPVFILVACLGIYYYTKGRWALAAFWWSLGVWIRPDGLLLALAGIFLRPKPTVRGVMVSFAAAAPALLAFFAFNFIVGGKVFPNSVLVKTHPWQNAGPGVWEMVREWAPLWGLAMRPTDFSTHSLVLLPAMIAGALHRGRRLPAIGAFALGLPLAFALAGTSSGSHGRYLMPAIPFGVLLAVEGMDYLSRRFSRRWRKAVLPVLAGLSLAWQIGALERMGKLHGWNVENINHMQRLLAGTIRANASPGDTIAVNDVGAMGYFSGCYVVDLVGLVSPRRAFPENLRTYHPKYLVIFPSWYRSYIDIRARHTRIYDPDSTYKYLAVAGAGLRFNTICSRDQMFVYARFQPQAEEPAKVQMIWH